MNKISFIQRLRNKFKIQGTNNSIQIASNVRISSCKILLKGENNSLIISDKSILRDISIEIVGNNCSIQIGKNCIIGGNCYLSAKEENSHIIINDECMFSRNIKIMTYDGHPIFFNNQKINEAKSVNIGKHIWLADNVTILKNVTIEDGSIIGINSTVTKNIPKNSIAVGNPAIVVKKNIRWEI